MLRFLWSFLVNLVLAAVGLLLAKAILPGFHLEWSGFFLAVLVLTVLQAVLAPFVFNMARQYASALLGGIGIVSTLLALFLTSLLPGGVSVDGLGTWILAALIIWVVMALGGWLLLGFVLKRVLPTSSAR